MSSIDRATTRRRGIRMAMQVAALSGAAAAIVMAAVSSDARADTGGTPAPSDQHAKEDVGPVDALSVHGLGRFSCMSRGPAAPPREPEDYAALVARVPS